MAKAVTVDVLAMEVTVPRITVIPSLAQTGIQNLIWKEKTQKVQIWYEIYFLKLTNLCFLHPQFFIEIIFRFFRKWNFKTKKCISKLHFWKTFFSLLCILLYSTDGGCSCKEGYCNQGTYSFVIQNQILAWLCRIIFLFFLVLFATIFILVKLFLFF